ncbi:hypothetical protein HDR61_00115 [bacterium]|nr:hypothetical protein [bacterium]
MEQVPEKFLNKDGSVNTDALIKSYTALEKKIGTMVSVPTADSDNDLRSKFNHAIGVPDSADEYPISAMFEGSDVRQRFHEIGLTKSQVEKIYQMAEEFLSPVISDLFGMQNDVRAKEELKNFFGSEEKMMDALHAINDFGTRFLPADAFESLCATPQGIQGLYRMMQSMEPDVRTEKNASENFSDSDLRRMMRDPKYWRDAEPEYVRKIENGFKKLYS